ncbi:UNVERIFIED_CONTAM: Retrovirus-related Pol polyprotein from transposon TNT 1-94 [Sesamum latifolium]|uniref:Retrovirus-related Pol polyprotein from transposon TNT 1-94 n=1 Tax=Sesamum latifolium TaxID=2727402 RepID=A0AAW2X4G7_9LAMI
MFVVEVNMVSNAASCVLDTGCGAHICNNLQVLERSRKLSKDEMIRRPGDGKIIAVEAMGKEVGRLKESRIDDLDNLPTCESCLKGKMTKKPFVGQSAITNGLLDLVHTDVCGPLNILARGGFSCFITFIDDHSRYGYIYLMRYKSEAFGRFKKYRLEVENQTGRKIKALRSDRGGEYLSSEFVDYLKENGILSQWTPPGTPQLNRVAERRNRTLLDMHGKPASYKYLRVWGSPTYVKTLLGDKLDSRSSLCKFIEYPKETVGYDLYNPAKQKISVSRNAVFLEKSFPLDSRRDAVLIEESSEEPQHDNTTSCELPVHTDGVPVLQLLEKATVTLASYQMIMMPNPNRILYSSLMVVWSLRRVPSRIPERIPPRKLNTLQLRKLLRRWEMVSRGDCRMDRVSSAENTADPLTKPMLQIVHTQHLDKMGLRSVGDWL